ncbi:MAG: long-chain fatty acid--CoA ligase [Gemmatimonadota bacterium]|nr:long-chain fatty acid--CoA ligase [Gemmatimonadota bacterium]
MTSTAVAEHKPFTAAATPPAATTLSQLFFNAVQRYDKPDAFQFKVGGTYQSVSHRTIAERVRHAALGLKALGVARGDRVAILSENRPEWAIADYACLTAGITDVPIYPSLPAEQAAYIIKDAGCVAIFVSTDAQAAKIAEQRKNLAALKYVIGFGATAGAGVDITLADLEAKGAAAETPDAIAQYKADALAVVPSDLATLIYTSGTTGEPKGAMLTHGNLASNVAAVIHIIPPTNAEVSLSFLPLSHVLERMFDFLMFAGGVSIAYVESMDTILANIGEVKPTLVVSVPRIYEKIYAGVLEKALAGSAIKKQIFFWAKQVGDDWSTEVLAGRAPSGWLAFKYKIANRLVFSKLRERVGGRLKFFVSGGAPLAPEINKFFYSAGLLVLEGYGLTETSPVIAVNTPEFNRIGTVGKPQQGIEVKIAADGEILTRGPHVMKGYYNKPEATREAIDADGWFHTGDIGVMEDGYLRITDRKKDIIVTAGGKNIAPQPIENAVKTNKYVSQAVMIGDKRKYPVMLIVPNYDQLEKWAKIKKLSYTDHKSLIAQPLVLAKIEKEVKKQLPSVAHFEMPKRIGLLEKDFTIESGEMTPTLKVKRRVVDKKYKEMIDGLYTGGGEG